MWPGLGAALPLRSPIDPKNPQVILAGARNSLLFQSAERRRDLAGPCLYPKRQFGEVSTILIDPLDNQPLPGRA